MPQTDCVAAVFLNADDARTAAEALQRRGWRDSQISVIARGDHGEMDAAGPMRQGDRMEKSAAAGATAGATIGLLAGSTLLMVPGIGPVVFAGALASGITGGLVGGIVGAMSGWGIKEDHLKEYEQDIRDGKAVVVLTGNPRELAEGEALMHELNAESATLHAESADSTVDR